MDKRKGFTLIELLVVIAIIAVLMSIMMPALNKAKMLAKDAVDMANQHTFGLFWKLYTDDHDGKFPPRGGGDPFADTMGGWPKVLVTYMPGMDEEIWKCPGAVLAIDKGGRYPYAAWWDQEGSGPRVEGSYTCNFWVANGDSDEPPTDEFNLNCFGTPAVKGAGYVPLLMCANWKDAQPYEDDEPPPSRAWIQEYGWEPDNNEMKRVCHYRHGRTVNANFLDFSAKKVGLKHLWRTRWHKTWDMTWPLPDSTWPGGVWPAWMAYCADLPW
ncbi:MAG: type II secretion system protein [Planctomycetota bacterium]|jgi:prepilin-type N-terminal cleavage/methylation domain-containing protein